MQLILPIILCFYMADAQTIKKSVAIKTTTLAKASPSAKTIPLVKAAFLKHSFLLDTAVFSSVSIDSSNVNRKKLNIKLRAVKSADIDISDVGNFSVTEATKQLKNGYDKFSFRPDDEGYTYESPIVGKTYLNYNGKSIIPVEYKMVYHGTKSDQQLTKAMSKMPPLKSMNGEKDSEKKPVDKFDNDDNNRVVKFYLLNYSPLEDKGFMILSYEANYAEDKKNGGAQALQTLFNGISRLKINEQIVFNKVRDSKFLIDLALPVGSTGDNGYYHFPYNIMVGNLSISSIPDASAGYAAILEKHDIPSGSTIEKSAVEQQKLFNGINIYTRTFTIARGDGDDKTVRYELVSVLVPEKKIIKKTLLFILSSYSSDPAERNSLNAFILNSISLTGTLTKAALDKVKDNYLKND